MTSRWGDALRVAWIPAVVGPVILQSPWPALDVATVLVYGAAGYRIYDSDAEQAIGFTRSNVLFACVLGVAGALALLAGPEIPIEAAASVGTLVLGLATLGYYTGVADGASTYERRRSSASHERRDPSTSDAATEPDRTRVPPPSEAQFVDAEPPTQSRHRHSGNEGSPPEVLREETDDQSGSTREELEEQER